MRHRLSVLGLVGAALIGLDAPWSRPVRAAIIVSWLGSPLVFLPWILWTVRFRIGAPRAASDLFSGELGQTDEGLRTALGRIESVMQKNARRLSRPRLRPVSGSDEIRRHRALGDELGVSPQPVRSTAIASGLNSPRSTAVSRTILAAAAMSSEDATRIPIACKYGNIHVAHSSMVENVF